MPSSWEQWLDFVEEIRRPAGVRNNEILLQLESFTQAMKFTAGSISHQMTGQTEHNLSCDVILRTEFKVAKQPGYGWGPGPFYAHLTLECFVPPNPYIYGRAGKVKFEFKGPKNNDDFNRIEIAKVCAMYGPLSHSLTDTTKMWAFRHRIKIQPFEEKTEEPA